MKIKQLTKNFSLQELIRSSKAEQLKIDNTPSDELIAKLVFLAEALERVRSALGVPIIVTSGYRCQALNKAVGGVTSGDHTMGRAADIVAPKFGRPYTIAKKLAPIIDKLGIGQLILESIHGKQWIHVSTKIPEKITNRILTITENEAKIGIHDVP
jgi:hypothetical protein